MKTPQTVSLLQLVKIPEPCSVPWKQMQGDSKVRFCTLCSKSVYNLSAMTGEEAEQVIRESGGHLCGQIERRRDGSIITKRDGSGRWRIARWLSAAAAAIVSIITTPGCSRTGGSIVVSPDTACNQPEGNTAPTRGEIMLENNKQAP